jgi:hypothetical protein
MKPIACFYRKLNMTDYRLLPEGSDPTSDLGLPNGRRLKPGGSVSMKDAITPRSGNARN